MATAKLNGSTVHTEPEKPLLQNNVSCGKISCSQSPKKRSAWRDLLQRARLLQPYLWPADSRLLQLQLAASFLILTLIRVVALLTPLFYKKIIDSFSASSESLGSTNGGVTQTNAIQYAGAKQTSPPDFRWDYIAVYVLLVSLKGSGGYLTAARNVLWVRVQQHAARNLQIALFEHLHSLSIGWHLSRKTGEVIKVVDRGVEGVTQILNITWSQLVPAIADIIIAVVYFLVAFDFWIGMIVLVTMVAYAIVAVTLSEWRAKYRRRSNVLENDKTSAAVDSFINFETVKVFAAEKWEVNRFAAAVYDHQSAEWFVQATANLYGSARISVMNLGYLAGCLFTAYYVTQGRFTPGDYVMYSTYVVQLYGPLNMLGAYYRMLQQSFIDIEQMFEILEEPPEVVDCKDADHLIVPQGKVEFKNVSFSYTEGYPILKNISFTVPPGKTIALVGESGGGKSTIIKLLYRLYDVESGNIFIDGQDVTQVTQNSLRKELGLVPQDTVLFHTDLSYNIRYGNPHAEDIEVQQAAMAANIHNTITALPEGYNTRIGERGLKLSGGERQRVAIARMILKAPKIVALDEATSALDSHTERTIQKELSSLCEGRTCLVIAHRLSTVTHADQILVLRDGHVIERGTHSELLSYNGFYSTMWQEQLEVASKPIGFKCLGSYAKLGAVTSSTPCSNHPTRISSFAESYISESSNEPIDNRHSLGVLDDTVVTDDFGNYHEQTPYGISVSEKLDREHLPKQTAVWPRRMSKSLVNLNPKESDKSRLGQMQRDRSVSGGNDDPPHLEHSISLCDAFSVRWESEGDVRKQKTRPSPANTPWKLRAQYSFDETVI